MEVEVDVSGAGAGRVGNRRLSSFYTPCKAPAGSTTSNDAVAPMVAADAADTMVDFTSSILDNPDLMEVEAGLIPHCYEVNKEPSPTDLNEELITLHPSSSKKPWQQGPSISKIAQINPISLLKGASQDLVSAMAREGAIDILSGKTIENLHNYPKEMTINTMSQMRALYNLSKNAAWYALENKIGCRSIARVKEILREHVDLQDANVFIMSQSGDLDHWVAVSREFYFDDYAYFQVTSYKKVCALLELCECGRQTDVINQIDKPFQTRRQWSSDANDTAGRGPEETGAERAVGTMYDNNRQEDRAATMEECASQPTGGDASALIVYGDMGIVKNAAGE